MSTFHFVSQKVSKYQTLCIRPSRYTGNTQAYYLFLLNAYMGDWFVINALHICFDQVLKAFKSVSCVLVMTNKRVICLYSISLTSFPLLFVQLGLLPCGHTPLRSSSMGIMRWTMETHGRSPSATNRQTNYPRRKIREAGRSSSTALMESMFH